MKRLILRLAVALLTFLLGIGAFLIWETVRAPGKDAAGLNGLTLVMRIPAKVVPCEDATPFTTYITNNSDERVTLAHPGNGSEVGSQTPIVQWSIFDNGVHPAFLQPNRTFVRCDNIHTLKWKVFTLDPGEMKQVEASTRPFTACSLSSNEVSLTVTE